MINQCIECRLISWVNTRVYLEYFNFKDHHKILLKLKVTLSKYQHVSYVNHIYLFISSILDQTHAHRALIWDSMTIHILSIFLLWNSGLFRNWYLSQIMRLFFTERIKFALIPFYVWLNHRGEKKLNSRKQLMIVMSGKKEGKNL